MNKWLVFLMGIIMFAGLIGTGYSDDSARDKADALEWAKKGADLHGAGKDDEALKVFDIAIKLYPNLPQTWYDEACIYSAKQDKKQTIHTLANAIYWDGAFRTKAKRDMVFKWLWKDEGFKKITKEIKGMPRAFVKPDYPETKAPDNPPAFLWNFSETKEYLYHFDQDAIVTIGLKLPTAITNDAELSSLLKGELVINSQGDKTGLIESRNVRKVPLASEAESDKPKTEETGQPVSGAVSPVGKPFLVSARIKEDGTGRWDNSDQAEMLALLFPLPSRTLKVGESIDMPIKMPCHILDTEADISGTSTVSLTKYVKVGDRTCARFDVVTNAFSPRSSSGKKAKYTAFIKAIGVFYFDINHRCFACGTLSAVFTVVESAGLIAPLPKTDESQEIEKALKKLLSDITFSNSSYVITQFSIDQEK